MSANGGRPLRKPVFVKVETLKPGTNGHTLVVKVVNSNTVLQKGAAASPHLRNTRIAECLVGDDTASILFTARNDQGILLVLVSNVFQYWFNRFYFSFFYGMFILTLHFIMYTDWILYFH